MDGAGRARLELAKDALSALLGRLRATDGFGLATFTREGRVIQDLRAVSQLDLEQLLVFDVFSWFIYSFTITCFYLFIHVFFVYCRCFFNSFQCFSLDF